MHELFIYYRASAAHTTALQAAVQAMQHRLMSAHPGLQARLLRRAGEEDTAAPATDALNAREPAMVTEDGAVPPRGAPLDLGQAGRRQAPPQDQPIGEPGTEHHRTAPEHCTWMETYALPTGIDAALQAEIARAAAQAVGPWLVGERHTEAFAACA